MAVLSNTRHVQHKAVRGKQLISPKSLFSVHYPLFSQSGHIAWCFRAPQWISITCRILQFSKTNNSQMTFVPAIPKEVRPARPAVMALLLLFYFSFFLPLDLTSPLLLLLPFLLLSSHTSPSLSNVDSLLCSVFKSSLLLPQYSQGSHWVMKLHTQIRKKTNTARVIMTGDRPLQNGSFSGNFSILASMITVQRQNAWFSDLRLLLQ